MFFWFRLGWWIEVTKMRIPFLLISNAPLLNVPHYSQHECFFLRNHNMSALEIRIGFKYNLFQCHFFKIKTTITILHN